MVAHVAAAFGVGRGAVSRAVRDYGAPLVVVSLVMDGDRATHGSATASAVRGIVTGEVQP